MYCAGGIQRREVVCTERDSGVRANDSLCNPILAPKNVQKCNEGKCRVTDYGMFYSLYHYNFNIIATFFHSSKGSIIL